MKAKDIVPRKKHHYRPVGHLKGFCDPADDRLWSYSKSGRYSPRRFLATEVGAVNYLYAAAISDEDQKSDIFEQWLATEVDEDAAIALAAIAKGDESFDSGVRIAISRFVAAQDVRTPQARDFIVREMQRGMNLSAPERHREAWRQTYGREPTDEEIASTSWPFVVVRDEAWLNVIHRRIEKQTEYIHNLHWALVEAPAGLQWLTNDVGLVRFAESFQDPPPPETYPPFGGRQFLMPVSERLALALTVGDENRPKEFSQWVKRMNRCIIRDAVDNVFSRSYFAFVEDNWRKQAAEKR